MTRLATKTHANEFAAFGAPFGFAGQLQFGTWTKNHDSTFYSPGKVSGSTDSAVYVVRFSDASLPQERLCDIFDSRKEALKKKPREMLSGLPNSVCVRIEGDPRTRQCVAVDNSPSTVVRRRHLVGVYYCQISLDHLLSVRAPSLRSVRQDQTLHEPFSPSRHVNANQHFYLYNSVAFDKRNFLIFEQDALFRCDQLRNPGLNASDTDSTSGHTIRAQLATSLLGKVRYVDVTMRTAILAGEFFEEVRSVGHCRKVRAHAEFNTMNSRFPPIATANLIEFAGRQPRFAGIGQQIHNFRPKTEPQFEGINVPRSQIGINGLNELPR